MMAPLRPFSLGILNLRNYGAKSSELSIYNYTPIIEKVHERFSEILTPERLTSIRMKKLICRPNKGIQILICKFILTKFKVTCRRNFYVFVSFSNHFLKLFQKVRTKGMKIVEVASWAVTKYRVSLTLKI